MIESHYLEVQVLQLQSHFHELLVIINYTDVILHINITCFITDKQVFKFVTRLK